ncbi:MAG: hypothetical protein ACHQ03_07975 [Candidatus Bathyarchaeia archaeon]
MIDWVALLAPLLLTPITLLLVFVGCGLPLSGNDFVTFTLTDQKTAVSATVNDSQSGGTTSPGPPILPPAATINVNSGDPLVASVTSGNLANNYSGVIIWQSATGSPPWNPSPLFPTGIIITSNGSSGGDGSSPPFPPAQSSGSFYMYADNGIGCTPIIQVNILTPPPPPPGTTSITIGSNPSGPGYVQVDGNQIMTPQIFNWQTGSTHTIAANSPVGAYVFQSWSDGGAQTHIITVPATSTAYAANYSQSPPPPPTPITRIRFARGTAFSGLTIPVTIVAPTNGNTLIAVIGLYGSNNLAVSGITQTGAIWVRDVSRQTGNGNGDVEIWRASNVQNAGASITIALTGSGALVEAIAEICEYSGLTNTNPLDRTGTNTGVSGTPTIGTMVTTSQAKELWIAGITHLGNDTQTNPTNGFNFTDPTDGVATNNMSLAYLEYIASSTSTPSTAVTVSSNFFAASIATYRGS